MTADFRWSARYDSSTSGRRNACLCAGMGAGGRSDPSPPDQGLAKTLVRPGLVFDDVEGPTLGGSWDTRALTMRPCGSPLRQLSVVQKLLTG